MDQALYDGTHDIDGNPAIDSAAGETLTLRELKQEYADAKARFDDDADATDLDRIVLGKIKAIVEMYDRGADGDDDYTCWV